jgi:hypothetical protein
MQTVSKSMFKTNMSIRISLTAVVLAAAIASASAVLEIGIINGSQAQVTPSSPTSPSPTTNKTVSPELKSEMYDPNNPKLRFVNTTESNICGIPKTIKNVTTTTPTTPTPTPSSPKPITPTPSETTPTPQEPIPGLP